MNSFESRSIHKENSWEFCGISLLFTNCYLSQSSRSVLCYHRELFIQYTFECIKQKQTTHFARFYEEKLPLYALLANSSQLKLYFYMYLRQKSTTYSLQFIIHLPSIRFTSSRILRFKGTLSILSRRSYSDWMFGQTDSNRLASWRIAMASRESETGIFCHQLT